MLGSPASAWTVSDSRMRTSLALMFMAWPASEDLAVFEMSVNGRVFSSVKLLW
jgi:hypothetical protein